MMLEDAPTNEDNVLEANGMKVYVDGKSIDLLRGSSIDYVDTLMGAGFTVNNPNAVSACGCGSSFRTTDSAGALRAPPTARAPGPRPRHPGRPLLLGPRGRLPGARLFAQSRKSTYHAGAFPARTRPG
jgi:iron-sulfur cluster assembly protein